MVNKPTSLPRLAAVLMQTALLFGCSSDPVATPATPSEIKQRIAASGTKLLLVHAWATWCQPCREEFPVIVRIVKQYGKSIDTLLVSADDPSGAEAVQSFLIENSCPLGSLVSTDLGQTFVETLSPNWSGALPATFLYDSSGNLLTEWEGPKNYEHYTETIEQLLITQGGLK